MLGVFSSVLARYYPRAGGLAGRCLPLLPFPLHPSASQLGQTFSSASRDKTPFAAESIPLRTGRPRLVVLGTGWAAARLLRDIDPKLYDLTVSRMATP